MQTLCLWGRPLHWGDRSAKWNMFAFPCHIRTVMQHSPHLLKSLVCHLTPPHDFLSRLLYPVTPLRTTPLATLSSIVAHFLWTSKGMWGWPFEDTFRNSLQEMTIECATKIPQCLHLYTQNPLTQTHVFHKSLLVWVTMRNIWGHPLKLRHNCPVAKIKLLLRFWWKREKTRQHWE